MGASLGLRRKAAHISPSSFVSLASKSKKANGSLRPSVFGSSAMVVQKYPDRVSLSVQCVPSLEQMNSLQSSFRQQDTLSWNRNKVLVPASILNWPNFPFWPFGLTFLGTYWVWLATSKS